MIDPTDVKGEKHFKNSTAWFIFSLDDYKLRQIVIKLIDDGVVPREQFKVYMDAQKLIPDPQSESHV